MPLDASKPTSPVHIVVATSNPGKLSELRELLGDGFEISTAAERGATMPEETGATFDENAILKATAIARQTGEIALADDSGLEVDHLDGLPGVLTARFAGPMATDAANRKKLLRALEGIAPARRRARFVSVIAIAIDPDTVLTARGNVEGHITHAERGTGGFGYDPIFELASGKTMAELEAGEKNAISHRGAAMRQAIADLRDRLGLGDVDGDQP